MADESEAQHDNSVSGNGSATATVAPQDGGGKRTRRQRPYPSATFEDVLPLAEAIQQIASGERARRLTLLDHLGKSQTSSATQMLITNSAKYGLTKGSYTAEFIELTEAGRRATNPSGSARDRRKAQFELAIQHIAAFDHLYDLYKGKKMPANEVLRDSLADANVSDEHRQECADIFVVNCKSLGLLKNIAGSNTLVPIEQVLEEIDPGSFSAEVVPKSDGAARKSPDVLVSSTGGTEWSKTCFYITPIGEPDSNERKHSDLFLNYIVEPALREVGLQVVRADQIGASGMITSQVLEHVIKSRLAVADLSFHNPNAFYEMAIRHVCKLPTIQICRARDRIPFDLSHVRTIQIDDESIYTLIPQLETYKAEIASQARLALETGHVVNNPVTVYAPRLQIIFDGEAS